MPIIAVYVDRSKCNHLFNLLTKLHKLYGGEIILDYKDVIETDQYVLISDGVRPFFKVKQN